MARPRFKPNPEHRKMVEAMSGYGMTEEQIAILVGLRGIDPKTLRKYFRQELSRGQAQAMAKLTQTAYQMATVDKNVSMAIFLLKTRGGWRETGNFNPGGPHEQPIEPTNTELDRILAAEFDRIVTAGRTEAVSGAVECETQADAPV